MRVDQLLSVLLISGSVFGACRHTAGAARPEALVTEQQAERAATVVAAIDYLPFSYLRDSCYARQFYMAMELATQEIPSSSLYIVGDLNPKPRINWHYHVAPMIVRTDAAGLMTAWILDPSFQEAPMMAGDWLSKALAVPGSHVDRSYYTAGSDYLKKTTTQVTDLTRLIPNFAAMPAFKASDIISACSRTYYFLGLESGTDREKKRAKLVARTGELWRKLEQLGKYESNLPSTYHDIKANDEQVATCYQAFTDN